LKIHHLSNVRGPILLSCLIALAMTMPSMARAEPPITGLLVFPISAPTSILKRDQHRQLKSYLIARLTIERFSVMPDLDVKRRLIDLKIQSYDDCYDESCRIEIGKALSADKTLSIDIVHEGRDCRITAVMFDIRTEVTVAAGDKLTGCQMADLRSGLASIASQLSSEGGIANGHRELRPFPTDIDRVRGQTYKTQPPLSPETTQKSTSRPKGDQPITPNLLKFERSQMEWFAMRFNGGNYGGGVEISLFTLRWPHFLWEIARGGFSLFGPGFGGGADSMGFNAYAGTAFGYPLHIGNDNKHEIRFMTGVFAGIWNQNIPDDGSESWELGNQSVGPFVLVEFCYVHHVRHNMAIQTGLNLLVPTYAVENDLPDPSMLVFIGFRI